MSWFWKLMDSLNLELQGVPQSKSWQHSFRSYKHDDDKLRHDLVGRPYAHPYLVGDTPYHIFTNIVSYPLLDEKPHAAYGKMFGINNVSFGVANFHIGELEVLYTDTITFKLYGLCGSINERTAYTNNITIKQNNGISLIRLSSLNGGNYDLLEDDFGFDEITKIKYLSTGLSKDIFELD